MFDPGLAAAEPFSVTVNVLYHREAPNSWSATAMEMDLQGFGTTQLEAQNNLVELVCMQIAFAVQKKQTSMIFRSAEPHVWDLFNQTRAAQLQSQLMPPAPAARKVASAERTYGVGSMPINDKLIAQARRKPFQRAYAA